MNDSRLPTLLYLAMLALGVLNWVRVYPQLPDIMASHFNARGVANGWAPKPAFFLIMAIAVAVTALVGFVAPRQIALKPAAKLNLPHKDYWLAPAQREATFGFIRAQMIWFGCAVLFVMLYGTSQAINANLPSVGYFDGKAMMYVMGGFGLFCIAWLVHLLRHFYRVPPSSSASPLDCWPK